MKISAKELLKAGLCAGCLKPGIKGKARYHDECRPMKHGNRKTKVDGVVYDSSKEARRIGILRLLEKAGQISQLKTQQPFECVVNGKLICKWIADAVYVENGTFVVEDVKSKHTRKNPVYRIKKKLVEAIFGITIVES